MEEETLSVFRHSPLRPGTGSTSTVDEKRVNQITEVARLFTRYKPYLFRKITLPQNPSPYVPESIFGIGKSRILNHTKHMVI
jgi:hypothetical protein